LTPSISLVAGPNDAIFEGVDSDLDAVSQTKLGEDASNVALDGGLAEVELGSDLSIR
jgi:hypothetical protein